MENRIACNINSNGADDPSKSRMDGNSGKRKTNFREYTAIEMDAKAAIIGAGDAKPRDQSDMEANFTVEIDDFSASHAHHITFNSCDWMEWMAIAVELDRIAGRFNECCLYAVENNKKIDDAPLNIKRKRRESCTLHRMRNRKHTVITE